MMGIYIYCLALLAQILATLLAVHLYLKAKSYRLACGLFALGFGLMIGRRISPIFALLEGQQFRPFDAWLALLISLLLLFAIFQVKRVWGDLEGRNFLLDQSLKVDSLTGALSRSETFSRAKLELERSLRTRQPIAFLMIDIDRFKNINDSYGHVLGDHVLKNLVMTCQQHLRTVDIFGRVGGEEFLAILPGVDETKAQEVAERVRLSVASSSVTSPIVTVDGVIQEIRLTVSIGVAIYDPPKESAIQSAVILTKYYEFCDKAMYQAKQAGRNQVMIYSS